MTRFYDIDDANDRLAELRPVLESLRADRDEVAEAQAELVRFRETNGNRDHADELKRREDTIRDVALPMGFVDVKVCAVSDVWSGLKLMIRRSERSKTAQL